jgi:formylglycine-generating enzyme required for sulfatase activity
MKNQLAGNAVNFRIARRLDERNDHRVCSCVDILVRDHLEPLAHHRVIRLPGMDQFDGELHRLIEAALKETHWADQDRIRSEAPQHKVILTQPIYLGVHEVTQGQYEQVMGRNPSHFAPMGTFKDAVAGMDTTSHPVETVSWNDAAEFCAKLSQQEQLKPFYLRAGETLMMLEGTGYRLPTEAEHRHTRQQDQD